MIFLVIFVLDNKFHLRIPTLFAFAGLSYSILNEAEIIVTDSLGTSSIFCGCGVELIRCFGEAE